MQLKPFKELIGLTKEKLNEAMAPIRARQVKAKADLEMSKIDTELLNLETVIQEACAEKDIDLPKLMAKLDEVALLERRKKQYGEVLAQLFPEEEPTK
jgi:hypothetical protein